MSGFKSRYCLVVGRKRPKDVELRLRVSANTALKLKDQAEETGEIRVSEVDFLMMLEPQVIAGHAERIEVQASSMDLSHASAEASMPVENILEEAMRIIYGDREQAYGSPRFNLDTIAQFWSVYIDRKFPEHVQANGGHHVTAEDVAQLMILLKTARLIHNPTHRDSLVDQAGYAAIQNRIQGMPQ